MHFSWLGRPNKRTNRVPRFVKDMVVIVLPTYDAERCRNTGVTADRTVSREMRTSAFLADDWSRALIRIVPLFSAATAGNGTFG